MNYNPEGQYQYAAPAAASQPAKSKTWIIVLCVVLGVILIIALMIALSNAITSSISGIFGSISSEGSYYPLTDNIAVVYLTGTISASSDGYYNHGWLIDTINGLTTTNTTRLCVLS